MMKVLKNASWLGLDRFARLGVGFLVGIVVARHLGPDDFGVLSMALAMSAIFGSMAGLGLDDIVLRESAATSTRSRALGAAWQMRCLSAPLAYLGVIGGACLLNPTTPDILKVAMIVGMGLLFSPAGLFDVALVARGDSRAAVVARQAALWITAFWRLLLVAVGSSLEAFAIMSAVEAGLGAAGVAYYYRKISGKDAKLPIERGQRRELLREGWPLMASGGLVLIMMQADRLLLGHWWGSQEVGIYAAATRLTEMAYSAPAIVGVALTPYLVRIRKDNIEIYYHTVRVAAVVYAIVGFGFAAILGVTAQFIIPLLFGENYSSAGPIAAVHVWSSPFVFLVSLRSRLFVIESQSRAILALSIVATVTNLSMNLILIPFFAAYGAAWSSAISWMVGAAVAPWLFASSRRMMSSMMGRNSMD